MISMNHTRRTFLRGLGVSLALPSLESFGREVSTKAIPLRLGFSYIPNGVIMEHWRPKGFGTEFTLPKSLAPLETSKSDIQVLSGLDHTKANANGDGGGDHARANATFLTGCQARKTAGRDIKIGISVDQVAAEHLKAQTPLPSLELSCDASRRSGKCDSGYSCAYQYNLSWKTDSIPMPAESNPRFVFERLFGKSKFGTDQKAAGKRIAREKSVLDFVLEDAKRMRTRLGYEDAQKLDEYFVGVREVESRISVRLKEQENLNGLDCPDGIPGEYEDHIRIMFDLQALAFRSDITRVSTFLLAHDGSNRSFGEIGVSEGHHSLSHHRDDAVKKQKLADIDRFYSHQFAHFLNKLSSFKERDGSRLLDHCMIIYGSGISDGNRHRHVDLPILLAGGKAHGLKTGRHHDFSGKLEKISNSQMQALSTSKDGFGLPMNNLYVGLLNKMGVDAESLGDSTGKIQNI